MTRVSRRGVLLNGLIAVLAILLAVSLVRDFTQSRPLPPSPPPGARPQAGTPAEGELRPGSSPEENLSGYNVIVAKYLFNQSRSEGTAATVAPAVPLPPRPLLMGVVVDGGLSRAYLEDPSTKRVFGYQVGDSVAGGRLQQIKGDKVIITRSDGAMEVMLHDPSKPRPEPPPAAAAAGARPRAASQPAAVPGATPQAATPQAATRSPQPENIPIPGRPPIAPRMIRRLPPESPQDGSTR